MTEKNAREMHVLILALINPVVEAMENAGMDSRLRGNDM